MRIEGLDELDNRILEIIRDDARLSYSEIGERAGISRTAVKTRMNAMQDAGIIRGFRTIIDPGSVPGGIRFFLDLECTPEGYEDAAEALAANPMVRQIYGVSGECRIHAAGVADSTRKLEAFANALFRSGSGVRHLSCHTVLSTIKDADGGVEYVRYQKHDHLEGRGEAGSAHGVS